MSKYNAKTSIHELVSDYAQIIKGKTILTTGVTPNSLGHIFASAVAAASPALLILAGRNPAKLQQTAAAIAAAHPGAQTRNLVVDLCSLASVRKAAEEVDSWTDVPSVDVVVNNAGVMAVDFALTPDGFETQFAASHIGHFLLTNLIMDKILASESPRVVNVSSDGHRLGPMRWADPHFSVSHLPAPKLNYTQNADRLRMVKLTTNGTRMVRPRLPTTSLPSLLPTSLASAAFTPIAYTQVSS